MLRLLAFGRHGSVALDVGTFVHRALWVEFSTTQRLLFGSWHCSLPFAQLLRPGEHFLYGTTRPVTKACLNSFQTCREGHFVDDGFKVTVGISGLQPIRASR